MPEKGVAGSDRYAEVLERQFVNFEGALEGRGASCRRGSGGGGGGVVGGDTSSSSFSEEGRSRSGGGGGDAGVRGTKRGVVGGVAEREDLGTPWSGLETVFEDLDEDRDEGDGDGFGECECGGFEGSTGELCLRHGVVLGRRWRVWHRKFG
jgi:hypothetical protein